MKNKALYSFCMIVSMVLASCESEALWDGCINGKYSIAVS